MRDKTSTQAPQGVGVPPVFERIRDYRGEWLPLDVIVGLTTAAVVIPKAMACTTNTCGASPGSESGE